jgi:transposase
MIGVDKIEDIRRRARGGEPIASIARAVGVSEPTARKYARMEDLSPEPPKRKEPESELLAPHRETIDSRLDDDCRNWRKQRHTAVRVYVRLINERGYEGSYSTVQRYVKQRREEMARERDRRDAEGFLQLSWLPGEIQVDFGEADFRVRGVLTRGKYLTVTFPHSNVGLTQVFWGETAECVCQGLRSVFEFIGGVPRRAVFDNATEVGRRVGGEVRTSELFRLFAAHYGLDYTFTNPYSGNEKGNVENKVGCHRRNLFVPVPSFHDVASFNERLLQDCLDLSEGKRHYRLGTPELELFGEDREALSPLPPAAFSCVRWETRRCSKQGTFTLGGVHRYSAGPAYARCEVAVALGAFDVTVCDISTGEAIATYERQWGGAPTDSSDPTLQLRLLCMRPAGWRDSSVRASLPEELVAFLDGEPADSLKADLRVLRDESAERGWEAAVEGMSRSLAATGSLDRATVALSAARAAAGDERVEYDEKVDLDVYDGALRLLEGGGRHAADELGA